MKVHCKRPACRRAKTWSDFAAAHPEMEGMPLALVAILRGDKPVFADVDWNKV